MSLAVPRKQMMHFLGEKISKRHWRLKYTQRSDGQILMAGGTETKKFNVPFTFVLRRVHLTHRNTTLALATTEMQVTLSRDEGEILGLPKGQDTYYKKTDITVSKPIISFEDLHEGGLLFEAGTHTLTLTVATTTDLITPIIYIKELL